MHAIKIPLVTNLVSGVQNPNLSKNNNVLDGESAASSSTPTAANSPRAARIESLEGNIRINVLFTGVHIFTHGVHNDVGTHIHLHRAIPGVEAAAAARGGGVQREHNGRVVQPGIPLFDHFEHL